MLTNLVNVLDTFDTTATYTCGTGQFVFEGLFPRVISVIITVIKIGVPILLVILGMLDLGKAVMAQKEDEIKKGQSLFIKRLIAAILVFLVVFIVQIAVRFVAGNNNGEKSDTNTMSCINCFINGRTTPDKSTKRDGCWLTADE